MSVISGAGPICGCVGHLEQRVAGAVDDNPDQLWTAWRALGLHLTVK